MHRTRPLMLWAVAHGVAGLARPAEVPKYDAIIVAGGGIDEAGKPLAWVKGRLDAAVDFANETHFLLSLSRGTTHEPPPLDANGFPIDEAKASSAYFLEKGIEPERILEDTWSLDTIGNAAFARLMHAEPRRWQKMMVITSDWHMNRTRAIFDWVFGLPPAPHPQFEMSYFASPGMIEPSVLSARLEREAESLAALQTTISQVTTLPQLHQYIFSNHSAYAAAKESFDVDEDKALAASYKGTSEAADGDDDGDASADVVAAAVINSAAKGARAAHSASQHVLAADMTPNAQQRLERARRVQAQREEIAAEAMWSAIAGDEAMWQ